MAFFRPILAVSIAIIGTAEAFAPLGAVPRVQRRSLALSPSMAVSKKDSYEVWYGCFSSVHLFPNAAPRFAGLDRCCKGLARMNSLLSSVVGRSPAPVIALGCVSISRAAPGCARGPGAVRAAVRRADIGDLQRSSGRWYRPGDHGCDQGRCRG
jgi:hypothetical protein